MLEALQQLIRNTFSQTDCDPSNDEEHLKLATAALLILVSAADANESGDEQDVIYERLSRLLSLTPEESRSLYWQAQKTSQEAISVYEFTHQIKEQDYQQRYQVVVSLWEVAYADQQIDPHEEALIRQIADLLYVTHDDFIKAKLSVTSAQD